MHATLRQSMSFKFIENIKIMKKVIVLAVLFLGVSFASNAQLKTNTTTKVEKTDTRTVQEKIDGLKYNLKALDQKEAWIRSNPEELKIANKEGWFAFADKIRAEIKLQIAELENKKK